MEENLKITCEKAQELLFEDRDANSGPAERMLLSNHLASCDDCREMAELLEIGEGRFKAKFEQCLQSGRLLERALEHHLWELRYPPHETVPKKRTLEVVRQIAAPRITRRVVYSLLAAAAVVAAVLIYPSLHLKSYFVLGQIAQITRVGTDEMRGEWRAIAAAQDVSLKWGDLCEFRPSDGSRVRIGGPASLRIVGKREILLHEGVIYLNIAKSKKNFIVRTPDGEVRQLGTEYYVSRTEGKTTVAVLEGSVEFQRGADTLPLQSAQYAVAQKGASLYSQSFSPERIALLRQLSAAPEMSALAAALGIPRFKRSALLTPAEPQPPPPAEVSAPSEQSARKSQPLVEIRGRVAFKANGLPVAGAAVVWGENPAPPYPPGAIHKTETDDRGNFSLSLPPDAPFFIYAAAGGLYAPVRVADRAIEWRNAGQLLLQLDLTPAIGGIVSSASAQPIEGGKVVFERYSPLLGTYKFLLQVPIPPGDHPRYVSPPLPEGRYRVRPHVAGYALAGYRIVTLGTLASDPAVDFSLLPSAGAIKGFIGTPVGVPIPGAYISADGTYETLSDENWAFSLTEFRAPHHVRIHKVKEGYYPVNVQADVPPPDS
ncbi:MAG: FecR domain-containing protein [bacterium]